MATVTAPLVDIPVNPAESDQRFDMARIPRRSRGGLWLWGSVLLIFVLLGSSNYFVKHLAATASSPEKAVLKSRVGEPLNAEMQASLPDTLSPDEVLTARLGTQEEYGQQALLPPAGLDAIEIHPIRTSRTRVTFLLAGRQPFSEPTVNFLLVVEKGNGQTARAPIVYREIPLLDAREGSARRTPILPIRELADSRRQTVDPDGGTVENSDVAPVAVMEVNRPAGRGKESRARDSSIREEIHRWSRAWQQQDIPRYLDQYSPDYRPSHLRSHGEWVKERTEKIRKNTNIRVVISNVSIRWEGDHAIVVFRQTFKSASLTVRTKKRLVLAPYDDAYKIIQEEAFG
jgi:hypothetical protein